MSCFPIPAAAHCALWNAEFMGQRTLKIAQQDTWEPERRGKNYGNRSTILIYHNIQHQREEVCKIQIFEFQLFCTI